MVLEGPYGLSSTVAATDGPRATDCGYDTLTITNPGGTAPPIICGYNSGQHIYIPASESCNSISIDIDTGTTSTTRKWQIKVILHNSEKWKIVIEVTEMFYSEYSIVMETYHQIIIPMI